MTAVLAISPLGTVSRGATESMRECLLSPLQALTARFELGVASEIAPVRPGTGQPLAVTHRGIEQFRQGFRLGALRLMIGFEDGSELTEMPELYRLPNVADWFCGMANLHGILTPVFDLARYLRIEPQAGAKRMLLVLSHGPDAAGVLIDGLPERLRWSDEQRADAEAAPSRLAPLLRGACLIKDGLWFDLDVAALLNALEQAVEAS